MARKAVTTLFEKADLVRKWFDQAEMASGPLLPDGWFGGRPGENLFTLLSVEVKNNFLLLKMDADTSLCIEDPASVRVDNSDLVFDGFRQATLRWKHYGGDETAPFYERVYEQGQVRLAAPIGTTVNV